MKSYKLKKTNQTSIERNESVEGETIEQKIERIVHNGEPITDGAPIIYTERKHGVEAQYDIRTDRFDIAVDAMTKVAKTETAKRQERIDKREAKIIEMKPENNSENNQKNG